jgi:hypothetical protein
LSINKSYKYPQMDVVKYIDLACRQASARQPKITFFFKFTCMDDYYDAWRQAAASHVTRPALGSQHTAHSAPGLLTCARLRPGDPRHTPCIRARARP